jgi:hypothetical protein
MVSFLWWIIGFYWVVSGGDMLEQGAPRLYWYRRLKPAPIAHYIFLWKLQLLLCNCISVTKTKASVVVFMSGRMQDDSNLFLS